MRARCRWWPSTTSSWRTRSAPGPKEPLSETIARCGRVDLRCLDELRYMGWTSSATWDWTGAELLFQVLTEREETHSIVIASNDSFSGWTRAFTDSAWPGSTA